MSWAKCDVTGVVGKDGQVQTPAKRNFHTCSRVGDSLYIIGGTDGVKFFDDEDTGGVVWSMNIKDNNALKWEEVSQSGVLKKNKFMGRSRHTAVSIGSVIYVFGGVRGGNEVWCLETTTKILLLWRC